MSKAEYNLARKSKWLTWQPTERITTDSAESAPTKTSEHGFVGFEGAPSAESPEIEAGPDAAEQACANAVHSEAGVRFMKLEGVHTVGLWADRDGPEVRAALRTMGTGDLPIRYLDAEG